VIDFIPFHHFELDHFAIVFPIEVMNIDRSWIALQ